MSGCKVNGGLDFGIGNFCWSVFNGLLTTAISCLFSTRVRGSVTPLMIDAKELRDMVGSTSLKNIPTNSSEEGTVEDWSFLVWTS